ncbi:MAG: ABC transporter permease [Oscillospiraceae bacterium]|nr:ABC transporter permease [Oscillospiraceae bacterium]
MQHTHISAKQGLFDLKLRELWQYRDLVWLFTRRSFIVTYTQTILGPLWLIINPLLTGITYVVIFGNIARLSTDGVPQLLFYLSGHAVWSFFSGCVVKNASTFTNNAYLFGKVYFPRLVIPVSNVLGNAILFLIQMLLVFALLLWYSFQGLVHPQWHIWILLPLLLLLLGVMGMGTGLIISSLTTKYRDLCVLLDFGMTLWMYATPVVYPLSAVDAGLRRFILINPVSSVIELFRFILFGVGDISPAPLAYSFFFTVTAALAGIVVFNHVERTFMDTV